MRYELTDLRLFHAIAECKCLSTAACRMHITAPSASYRLKNLENAIGAQLFVRSSKGMELTPAGIMMRVHVRDIMSSVDSIQHDLGTYATGKHGSIRIAGTCICVEKLLRCTSVFLSSHADVNLDVEERPSPDVVFAVLNHTADIGLIACDVDLKGLSSIHYSTDELVLVTALGHPWSGIGRIKFEDALECDFIAMNSRSSNYLFLKRMAAKIHRSYNVRINAESFPAALSLVEEGVGVAIVPRSVASSAVREGRIAMICLEEPWAFRDQRIIVQDFSRLSKPAEALIDFLLDGKLKTKRTSLVH